MNSPKSAVIGGVSRARVSSQCWKRAVRMKMHDLDCPIANRTKFVEDVIFAKCKEYGVSDEQAIQCGKWMSMALGLKVDKSTPKKKKSKSKDVEDDTDSEADNSSGKSNTLFFLSDSEADTFVSQFIDTGFAKIKGLSDEEKKTFLKSVVKKGFNFAKDGLDIALFGRMVADAADLNIDAAASFAHAISIHKVTPELEFFTAVDDLSKEDESGSAHMGTLEYNAATYYRYISVDLGQLAQTLKTEEIGSAVEVFMKALLLAVPSARQTSMTASSPWDFAIVTVRKGQNLQIPFTVPVKTSKEAPDMVSAGISELCKRFKEAKEFYGEEMFGLVPGAEFEVGPGQAMNFETLKKGVLDCLQKLAGGGAA